MWLERWIWIAKPGRMDELLAHLREGREQLPAPHGHRILTCKFGALNRVEVETEWESWDEYSRTWEEWAAKPEFGAYMGKFAELIESDETHEWWEPQQ